MPKKCGSVDLIAAYVVKHPGCLRSDLLNALGLEVRSAMPTYATKIGLIFVAGPRGSQRYFPTLQEAHDADATLRAQAKQRRLAMKVDGHKRSNLRRRARRHAAGVRPANTRPGLCVQVESGMVLSTDIRMTPSRPMPGRWDSIIVPSVVCSADARPWAKACAQSLAGAV